MEIIQKNINEIKPDLNQPRKNFPEKVIKEMAKSILTEGVINPIEIDKDGVIVTGEIRWRAAKEAGLAEVPVKIIDPGENRFRRQVIENVHHNTMTTMETARALDKLLVKSGWKPSRRRQHGEAGKFEGDELVTKLADEIGKGESYIYDHINLLKESQEVQEYLENPESKYSLIRDIDRYAPEEFKEQLKQKVIKGEITSYRTALELARSIRDNPDKAEDLLKESYNGKSDSEIIPIIKSMAPQEKTPDDIAEEIIRASNYIIKNLTPTLIIKIPTIRKPIVAGVLKRLKRHLERYFSEEAQIEN